MCIVVVPELPATQATLPLRVLGRDAVLAAAMQDLDAPPPGAWKRRAAAAVVEFLKRRRHLEERMSERTDYLRKQYDEVIGKAERRGMQPLEHQFARRLGRALSAEERATLRARLNTVGPARLGDVVLDLDTATLAAWLADPAAT